MITKDQFLKKTNARREVVLGEIKRLQEELNRLDSYIAEPDKHLPRVVRNAQKYQKRKNRPASEPKQKDLGDKLTEAANEIKNEGAKKKSFFDIDL